MAHTHSSSGWRLRVWQIGERLQFGRAKTWVKRAGWFPRRKVYHSTFVTPADASEAAKQLGMAGRKKNTAAQQAAARENGKKGGRPPGS